MLSVDSLTKRFGDHTVIEEVTFEVNPGEIFGFIGANGAGKTTTMRIVMGVLAQTDGTVTWRDEPMTREVRRRFGYMPEERGLYQKMKVGEQIEYFARMYGRPAAKARSDTEELIERLELTELRGRDLEALSLGNQQRVQLAVALVHRPELLVLDEPFSGLDPTGVDALADLLRERRDEGVPIIFSSHQLDLVERMIDSVGIIHDGKLMSTGRVDDIRAVHGSQVMRIRLAADDGWTKRLPGTVVATDGDDALLDPGSMQRTDLMQALQQVGEVEYFAPERARLADLFRGLIS